MTVRFEPATATSPAQIHISVVRDDALIAGALDQTLATAHNAGVDEIELWIHAVTDQADRAATDTGAVAHRDLWQLRCPLPAMASTIDTRAFTASDIDAFIAVNNRAFDWHPEQSGLNRASVEQTMNEAWFEPDGFRLYEEEGVLLGFCWTKLHQDLDPVIGEIYVIAVDPAAHGRGLGIPMTLAGLDWISDQNIDTAMLYVESDNAAANATYERIGFTLHHVDRCYRLNLTARS